MRDKRVHRKLCANRAADPRKIIERARARIVEFA